MPPPTLIIGSIFVLILLFIKFTELTKKKYTSKPLMTDNEKEFYFRLKSSLPEYHVFSQVALGAILLPNYRQNTSQFNSVRATFAQKIADYVICDGSLNVIAVIELDDKTHDKKKDVERDRMISQAGYKVLRWDSKNKPTSLEIKNRVLEPLSPT